MNYNDLKTLLSSKKITVNKFCEQLQVTRQGLQKSLDNGLLPYNKTLLLCQLLEISPNEFFGWGGETACNVATNIFGGHNEQNSNESIRALSEQLKEKDRQISRLLAIIEKGGKK